MRPILSWLLRMRSTTPMVVETTAQPMIASIRRSAAFRPEDAVGLPPRRRSRAAATRAELKKMPVKVVENRSRMPNT